MFQGLVQICGKLVPIRARPREISPDTLRVGAVVTIGLTTQRYPDLEARRLLLQICDLGKDIVRYNRHGYSLKCTSLNVCKRKVDMGQRASRNIIDRSFSATSCRQTPTCPVAGGG
jgi:hypothetical protein